jgi:hypothetical protein
VVYFISENLVSLKNIIEGPLVFGLFYPKIITTFPSFTSKYSNLKGLLFSDGMA